MRWIVTVLGLITFMAIVIASILWFTNHLVAAIIFWSIIAAGWMILIVVSVWAAASWWTAQIMERGAEIALRAQQANDAWDTRKSASLVQVMKAGMEAGRLNSSSNRPALPLPSQESGWLPRLSSFDRPALDINDDNQIEEL